MDIIKEAILQIEAQQKGKEHTSIYMVGEQLKDIIGNDGYLAELAVQDLRNKEMSLEKCEAKIHARADELHKQHGGNCACVSPAEAEKIIREFYGLHWDTAPTPDGEKEIVSLMDLI